MHGYDAKDLGRSFRTVRQNTIQIAEEIPEDKYSFHPAEGCRSVAETLRHIALAPMWGIQVHGNRITQLNFEMFKEGMAKMAVDEAALVTKSDIVAALKENGDKYATFLEGLTDEVLAEHVSFAAPGMPTKTRFEMVLSAKEHEMHHRAQLMLAERMIGIVPHLTRAMQERMAAMTAAAAKA
jgi:uncharacterized damage-inducible protein DinB